MKRLDLSLADFFADPDRDRPRAPGLHVSDVVRSLCASLSPDRYPPKGEADEEAARLANSPRIYSGEAVEDRLGDMLAGRALRSRLTWPAGIVRPGEIELDGLAGNADFLLLHEPAGDPDADPFLVAECKGTMLSSSHDPAGPKFTYFWWQLKSYCCMYGVRTGRLYVLHYMGNYKFEDEANGPGSPGSFRVYEDTWLPHQLQEHWQMLTAHAARMRARGEGA